VRTGLEPNLRQPGPARRPTERRRAHIPMIEIADDHHLVRGWDWHGELHDGSGGRVAHPNDDHRSDREHDHRGRGERPQHARARV